MAYTVRKLAQLSGISVRTLHFYDEIGLLPPAYVGENGYRYYEEKQLLTLQQILFFRELGIELKKVKKILKQSAFDQMGALCSHRKVLQKEISRMHQLIRTIDKTIKHLKGEETMSDKEMYTGFSPEKQAEYEKYLIDRYGEEARENIAESKRRVKYWEEEQHVQAKEQLEALNQQLTAALEQELEVDSAEVQALIRQHYQWINQFWTPTQESYAQLGELYNDHPDFKKYYDKYHPKLSAFLAQAMKVFAERELV